MSNPARWSLIIAALCSSSCASSAAPAAPATPAAPTALAATEPVADDPSLARTAEAEVRARERAWLDAYEQRDPAVMSDVLADGFLITFPDGGRMDRAAVVASAGRPRSADDRPPRFTTRGTVALARDGVIILIGHVVETRIDPQGGRRDVVSSYTDTWVREGARWRVLASHLSAATEK